EVQVVGPGDGRAGPPAVGRVGGDVTVVGRRLRRGRGDGHVPHDDPGRHPRVAGARGAGRRAAGGARPSGRRGRQGRGRAEPREGATNADRDAQFAHINARVVATQARGQPVVSVDAKKKELVGDFRNGGREWRPKGRPEEVRVYDFIDRAPDKGRVTPYGVY